MAVADNTCFGIASYNLHGINNGRSRLLELCDNANIHVIAIQEHWLNDANLRCSILYTQILWVLAFLLCQTDCVRLYIMDVPMVVLFFCGEKQFLIKLKFVLKLPLADVCV